MTDPARLLELAEPYFAILLPDVEERLITDLAHALRGQGEEVARLREALGAIVKDATKTEWECDIFTAELSWDLIEKAKTALEPAP